MRELFRVTWVLITKRDKIWIISRNNRFREKLFPWHEVVSILICVKKSRKIAWQRQMVGHLGTPPNLGETQSDLLEIWILASRSSRNWTQNETNGTPSGGIIFKYFICQIFPSLLFEKLFVREKTTIVIRPPFHRIEINPPLVLNIYICFCSCCLLLCVSKRWFLYSTGVIFFFVHCGRWLLW